MQCPHDGMPCSRKWFIWGQLNAKGLHAVHGKTYISKQTASAVTNWLNSTTKWRLTPDLVLFGIILIDLITSAKNDSPESMRPRSGIHTLLDEHN